MQSFSQHLVQLVVEDRRRARGRCGGGHKPPRLRDRGRAGDSPQARRRRRQDRAVDFTSLAEDEAEQSRSRKRSRCPAYGSPRRANEAPRVRSRRRARTGGSSPRRPRASSARTPGDTAERPRSELHGPRRRHLAEAALAARPAARPCPRCAPTRSSSSSGSEAGAAYGVPWQVLGAINKIESDYRPEHGPELGRRARLDAVHARRPGCGGEWMPTATVSPNPWDPDDAVFAAARYLAAAGGAREHRARDLCLQPRAVVRRRRAGIAATLGGAPFTAGPATLLSDPTDDLEAEARKGAQQGHPLSDALDRALGNVGSREWKRLRLERRLGDPNLTDAEFAELDGKLTDFDDAERASGVIDRLQAKFAKAVEALKNLKAQQETLALGTGLAGGGYVFPSRGEASFSDDFRFQRDTMWHHGNDIFAAKRHPSRGSRRGHGLQGRLERRRRQPALAPRRRRQRVLLRAPLGLLADSPARARRSPGARCSATSATPATRRERLPIFTSRSTRRSSRGSATTASSTRTPISRPGGRAWRRAGSSPSTAGSSRSAGARRTSPSAHTTTTIRPRTSPRRRARRCTRSTHAVVTDVSRRQRQLRHRPHRSGRATGDDFVYCHLSLPRPRASSPGAALAAGAPVGLVGSTGNSTGPHLHLGYCPSTPTPRRSPGSSHSPASPSAGRTRRPQDRPEAAARPAVKRPAAPATRRRVPRRRA